MALLLPGLSVRAVPGGLLWVLAGRRNASVQDLVVGTAVVYDWAYHPAEGTFPAGDTRSSDRQGN